MKQTSRKGTNALSNVNEGYKKILNIRMQANHYRYKLNAAV
jgi:hypothetical protein